MSLSLGPASGAHAAIGCDFPTPTPVPTPGPATTTPSLTPAPSTLTVVNNNDSGSGSLRQAIADATSGDAIDFAAGLSGQTITLTSGELDLAKGLMITGPADGITISGSNAFRVVYVAAGVSARISNVTMSNGSTAGNGGGVFIDDAFTLAGTLSLTNVTISNNRASDGAGIANAGGVLSLSNVTVSGNGASSGGGGGIFNGCAMTVTNSTVSGNRAQRAGGILNSGRLTIANGTVGGNIATDNGGGIYNIGSGALTLMNATVTDNTGADGGGIYNLAGELSLSNSTVTGNSAGIVGGGIESIAGYFTLKNSIVGKQTLGLDCGGNAPSSLGYNLDSDGSCSLTATGDLPNTNPMLDPLALNPPGTTQTHALQPGSPAIDHIPPGVNGCGTTISTDQRGVSRPQGSGCDIGAYERRATEPLPQSPTPAPTPVPTPCTDCPVGGIAALPVSGSGSGTAALPIMLGGGAALAVIVGVWFGRKRWLR